MNDEQRLRDRLEAIDVPPSRIDTEALLRAGRRRAFRRRSVRGAGVAALGTVLLLAVPPILMGARPLPALETGPSRNVASSATAGNTAARCKMSELPVPSGMNDVTVEAVDPTGRYVVGNSAVGQDFRPILWTDGQPQQLPVPGKSVQATSVNRNGVVVGLVQDPDQQYIFRYANGVFSGLRTLPKSWQVYSNPAINGAGDVVINVDTFGDSAQKNEIVMLWKAGSATAVKLPLPAGALSHDFTDEGTIVGGTYQNGIAQAAYTWDQQGKGNKLELPAGQAGVAYAARGDWATGGMWPSLSTALWNRRTGGLTVLTAGLPKSPGGWKPGPGNAVNAAGWVVAGGLLLRGDGVVELAVPKGETSRAVAVSDTGVIVGQALVTGRDDENRGPRLWRC
ncbi:hypothetical protein Rhe02_75650 [Rhizocola hellebori]|uniref:Uncharacterized protein n=1 Tax=Rhizocola hellebori TaxID=1392758 RepID=A0A8J3QEP2_9ACTN|nr:hypothetical protein [Rhizocola hellebori]GIH09498.1 hypothetical protein Rhe02_75650 [Rhizocola hellebori]